MTLIFSQTFPLEVTKLIGSFLTAIEISVLPIVCQDFKTNCDKYFGPFIKVDYSTMITFCSENGYRSLLEYVFIPGNSSNDLISTAAARCGHVEVLDWAIVNNCGYHAVWICTFATVNGHQNILEYHWKHSVESWNYNDVQMCTAAAVRGQLHIVKAIVDNNRYWRPIECVTDILNIIISLGSRFLELEIQMKHCDVLKFILEKGFWIDDFFSHFAKNGNIDILKWGLENKFPFDLDLYLLANNANQKEIMYWLEANAGLITQIRQKYNPITDIGWHYEGKENIWDIGNDANGDGETWCGFIGGIPGIRKWNAIVYDGLSIK